MNHKLLLCLFVILSLLVVMPLAFAAQVGLVLYMPFNGDINDASGNKFQAEVKGRALWVDGKFGKAMEFDGTTHIEIPDTTKGTLDGTPGLTIGIWVKQDAHHNNGIVVKLITGSPWPCSYNLETWSDGLAYFDVGPDAANCVAYVSPMVQLYI